MITLTQMILTFLVIIHIADYLVFHSFNPLFLIVFVILMVFNSYLYDKDHYNRSALDYLNTMKDKK